MGLKYVWNLMLRYRQFASPNGQTMWTDAVFSVDVLESLKTKASQSTLFTPKMYRFMIQLDTVEIYGE